MTGVLEPRRRYDAAAEEYERHRPGYPSALVDWVLRTTGLRVPARVADIGCGTGIATRLFAERGFAVVGVDHNAAMLAKAQRAGLARYVRAEAARSALASGSVELVTAAQCFHWFEPVPTLEEFRRILRPGGWCAAFWNLRAATPLVDEYARLLRWHTDPAEYAVLLKQEQAPAVLRGTAGLLRCHAAEFAHRQRLDFDGLLGRAYSSSCVKHGVVDPAGFERDLQALFHRHERMGEVSLDYRSVAVCWQPAARLASRSA